MLSRAGQESGARGAQVETGVSTRTGKASSC